MANQRIRHPISLKQILLFSMLIILVLGVSTTLVSTLIRNDDKNKAIDNNHTINGRTADTVNNVLTNLQNNSFVLFQAQNLSKKINQDLIADYFICNPQVIFISSSQFGFSEDKIFINPVYKEKYPQINEKILNYIKDKKTPGKNTVYEKLNDVLGVRSISCIYEYGDKDSPYYSVLGYSTEALSELMSTGSNNTTILITKDTDILINPDFESQETKYSIAKDFIADLNSKQIDNSQFLVQNQEEGNIYLSIHKIANELYVITSITEKSVYEVINYTTNNIILFSLGVLFVAIIIIRIFSNNITNPIKDLVSASNKIEHGEFELDIKPRTKDEIGLLTSSFIQMAHGLSEREKLMTSFSKFTNKTIAEKAARGELSLGGENRNATIFFSDIRSFTAMSEKMQPNEVVQFLNEYMTKMVNCVEKTHGVVDKYIGDAIMAVWGAPESAGSAEADAYNAVVAALMMRKSLYDFNVIRAQKNLPPVKIGCGINSGPVVAGQIGSEQRMEYTVIGDAVNLASRTEALNKPFATDVLITENTYNLIKDKVIVEEMPGVHVKGKTDPIRMFAVINLAGRTNPSTLSEVRKIIGTVAPDLSKVNTDDEEKKYSFQTK